MGNPQWQEWEDAKVVDGVKRGMSNEDIAETLPDHRTGHSVAYARRRLGLPPEATARKMAEYTHVVAHGPGHTVLTADQAQDEPIDDLLERTFERTRAAVARASARNYALARVVSPQPIGICFPSDQHITTSGATDMERMFADAELIRDTPGLYAVLGGDGIDNHVKHRSALINTDSKPSDEWRLFNYYLSVLGYKTLGIISGNHDDWSLSFAGIDMVAHLAKKEKVHYAPSHIVLTVELIERVGLPHADMEGQKYTIKVSHKYRYNSSLNLLHTVKRMYDQGGDTFDVGVVCHHHEAAMEQFNRHGLPRYAFRPGSYQIQTGYGLAGGFNRAYPTCPMVVLYPGERRIVPFGDIIEGVEYLTAVRSEE